MYQSEVPPFKQELTLQEFVPLFGGKQQIKFQKYNASV